MFQYTALWDVMLISVIVPFKEITAGSFENWIMSQKIIIMALNAIIPEIVTRFILLYFNHLHPTMWRKRHKESSLVMRREG